jgi:hypothetical protein
MRIFLSSVVFVHLIFGLVIAKTDSIVTDSQAFVQKDSSDTISKVSGSTESHGVQQAPTDTINIIDSGTVTTSTDSQAFVQIDSSDTISKVTGSTESHGVQQVPTDTINIIDSGTVTTSTDSQVSIQKDSSDTISKVSDSSEIIGVQQTPAETITTIESSAISTSEDSVLFSSEDVSVNKPVLSDNSPPLDSFNPLTYGRRFSFAFHIPYLYYNERIRLSDVIRSYQDTYGVPPEKIEGEPKSTEYGLSAGFAFKITRIFPHTGIMLRPQFSIVIGPGNTYDGSTQGIGLTNGNGDTIGIAYQPYDTTKTNIFFHGGLDIGYSNHSVRAPFALFTGIRYSFWHRDLGSNSEIVNYENYTWTSIPIGAVVYKSIGPKWVLGVEGAVDFMFYGAMQAELHARENERYGINFPEVILGNKIGYRLELMVGKKLNEHLFFQFMPFVSAYGFGKSNVEYATSSSYYGGANSKGMPFFEPESSTLVIGFNFSFNILGTPLK